VLVTDVLSYVGDKHSAQLYCIILYVLFYIKRNKTTNFVSIKQL